MTQYALDTDTATLLLRCHAQVCAHAAAVEAEQLSVTISRLKRSSRVGTARFAVPRTTSRFCGLMRRFNRRGRGTCSTIIPDFCLILHDLWECSEPRAPVAERRPFHHERAKCKSGVAET
jgi:hypothetical protein